jgi:hypothetical protein
MRKIFAIVICTALLLCMIPFSVFAEASVEQTDTATESLPSTEGASEEEKFTTDMIVDYVKEHYEEIMVIITLILSLFYQVRRHGELGKSVRAINNNSIMIAKNSENSIQNALSEMGSMSSAVTGYKGDIESLLTEFRVNLEEKKKLEQTLADVQNFLKTNKLASIELANEVAELLVLANIPNSVKDQLYSRHMAAVNAIAEAEKAEVNTNDTEREAE